MYPSIKNKKPWFKFFPADWQADPALRICSIGARGLWVEMLALMHQAEPYGHLLVQGRLPTNQQLAIVAGVALQDFQNYLAELEYAGVFSRTIEGIIYSRRMVRDERRSEEGRLNGAKGGNPTLNPGKRKKTRATKPPEKQPSSPSINQGVNPIVKSSDKSDDNLLPQSNHIPGLKPSRTHEPEARGHIPEAINPYPESHNRFTQTGIHHDKSTHHPISQQNPHDVFTSALVAVVSERKHD